MLHTRKEFQYIILRSISQKNDSPPKHFLSPITKDMDDIDSLYKARQTVVEMLTDRGYTIPDEVPCDSMTQFKKLYANKQCDIFVKEPHKCYVKFVLTHKVRPNILREHIKTLREGDLEDEDDLVMVIRNKPNSTLLRITKEYPNVQIFWIRYLMVNITHHALNPTFVKMTDPEIEALLKQYRLTSRYQLPIMLKDDPISRYYAFSTGTVTRVIRSSVTSGEYVSYRCIK